VGAFDAMRHTPDTATSGSRPGARCRVNPVSPAGRPRGNEDSLPCRFYEAAAGQP
jgi:hypothetical protein